MEICVDSIESVKRAVRGGASRLEVCSCLSEGGLTPTPGFIKIIKNYCSTIPIFAMIRLRSGDFVYTDDEVNAMIYDITILKDIGIDGFVFGALKIDNTIDSDTCRKIITIANPYPVTFHRAFDETIQNDPINTLEEIIHLGFKRILTSGKKNTAIEGLDLIIQLISKANNRIIIMPGGGITPDNILLIKNASSAKEYHASAKIKQNRITDHQIKLGYKDDLSSTVYVTSEEFVKQMSAIVKND